MNLRHLNENFGRVGFQNSQNWFRKILVTFPKVNLFRCLQVLDTLCIYQLCYDASNSPSTWGTVQGGGAAAPVSLVTPQSIEFTIVSLCPQRVVAEWDSMQNSLLFLIGAQQILNFELSRAVSFRNRNYLFVFKAVFIICTDSYSSV